MRVILLRSLNKWCGYFWDIGTKFNVICGVPMVGILVGVGVRVGVLWWELCLHCPLWF